MKGESDYIKLAKEFLRLISIFPNSPVKEINKVNEELNKHERSDPNHPKIDWFKSSCDNIIYRNNV